MSKYCCVPCQFRSKYVWAYERHIKSNKHNYQIGTEESQLLLLQCPVCAKQYKNRTGLWRHSKKCEPPSPPEPSNIMASELLITKMNEMQQQLKELKESAVLVPPPIVSPPLPEPRQHTEYIYLLQEREFYVSQQPIYKIGKTKQPNHKRFSSYPKGSVLLLQRICRDCDQEEYRLLHIFKEKFTQRRDIGTEYFEGDQEQMMDEINAK